MVHYQPVQAYVFALLALVVVRIVVVEMEESCRMAQGLLVVADIVIHATAEAGSIVAVIVVEEEEDSFHHYHSCT